MVERFLIKRLLIANRGEIAIRIMRACRELGVEAVAVYSDADARSPFVRLADRAVRIGAASPAESYLSIPNLMDAARATGADAIHPGYGFLSENAAFANACEEAGVIFVGPPSAVIARMGSKIEARRLMQSARIPIVPGETPGDQSDDGLRQAIERVGLPALVKASAGGGGKGMREIRDAGEVAGAVQAARREATASFGDGTLYVERLVERARHIEVQIFGDVQGTIVHLFERECSVQRRHQKVIEESPSPALPPALRDEITRAAVRAAAAVGYRNAGTVEFLVDLGGPDRTRPTPEPSFYFLEVNTRLQVEHPVTEAVTGADLLRAQLLVASGDPLPWSQTALTQRGHAIEARVYAEDPSRGFLPQAGRILLYREPGLPGVRIDAGIAEGSDIPVQYDPLLAKVIAAAETRELARTRLIAALRDFPILGVHTNIAFLIGVLTHPRFRAGDVDTAFLDAEGATIAAQIPAVPPAFVVDAMAAADAIGTPPAAGEAAVRSGWDPWLRLTGWRG